jgi:hypothetical protein
VGNIKGVGRIYQQTFIDTYSRVAFAKLYTTKHAITSADILNDLILPFFEKIAFHCFVFLQTVELSSKANLSITNMSSICHLKELIIPKPKFDILKQMASVNVCIVPCRKSFTPLLLGKTER